MASISSLSSINGLNLWLDATDLSTIVTTSGGFDVRQWNDKSSNSYNFIPIRSVDPPKLSTNGTSSSAILFDLASSFQLISKTKIPVNSTLDFFAVLTPYSLWGPRAPIFDSADITLSETDTRFNTQIYGDGNEFFRSISVPGETTFSNTTTSGIVAGSTIYKGNLYIGNNTDRSINSNFLMVYNRKNNAFEKFNVPMLNGYTNALAVYDGKLFTASSTSWEYYTPSTNTFMSTIGLATTNNTGLLRRSGALVVYRRNILSMPTWSWENNYGQNNNVLYAGGYKNAILQFSTGINRFSTIVSMSSNINTVYLNQDLTTTTSNFMVYKDNLYIGSFNNAYGGQLFRYNGTFFNGSHNLVGGTQGYLSLYWGSLIVPINSQRLYKLNDTGVTQNFGRLGYNMVGGTNGPSGNICTYKGNLWIQRYGSTPLGGQTYQYNNYCNMIEIFQGERGDYYGNMSINSRISGEQMTACYTSNLMTIHDGKLFIAANTYNSIYQYGNGTSVDQSFSTLVSGPILLQIRKTGSLSQMYLNGNLVESQTVNFTYSNQPARQMWIGGGAGTMTSGLSDCGSDHFQGAIHTIAQYNQILSRSDKQKVEGILAWTYGIQNVLPAAHPYANSRP
jgi:hypothetical protein